MGLKVDGFTKAFIKPGQSFCESIKGQEKSLIFSGGGVFFLDPPFNDERSTHLTQGVFYGMLRACVFVANIFQVPFLTEFVRRSNVSLPSRDVICRCVFVSGSIGVRPMANLKR